MFDGRFVGFADFLVREGQQYQVSDTKLARSAKVTALLQIAAYADTLRRSGIPVSAEAELIFGNGAAVRYRVDELIPVYLEQRTRLQRLLDEHYAGGAPVRWEDERVRACFRCPACEEQVRATDDLLLVAGMRVTQRAKLIDAGISTLAELADHTGPVAGLSVRTLDKLVAQAKLQVRQRDTGIPQFEVADPQPLALLPNPDEGDLFFDFEGDPLWTADGIDWGLEYLFGVLEGGRSGAFHPLWAHDRPRRAESTDRLPCAGHQATQALSQHAHLPLRRIREDGAAAARRTPRRRGGRSRRAAAQRDAGRPVSDCAQEYSGRKRIDRPQGAGAALHGVAAAFRRCHHGHRLDHPIRAILPASRQRPVRRGRDRAQGDRGLQPLRLPIHPRPARLAADAGIRIRHHTDWRPAGFRWRQRSRKHDPLAAGSAGVHRRRATGDRTPEQTAVALVAGRARLSPPRGQALLVGAFRPTELPRRRMGRRHRRLHRQ